MYSKNEQLSSNIDWFCFINEYPIHVASNGSMLPRNFAKVKDMKDVWQVVNSLPINQDINYELGFVQSLEGYEYLENTDLAKYLEAHIPNWLKKLNLTLKQMLYSWHFLEAARRGFYSFYWDDEKMFYRYIAGPTSPQLTPTQPFNMYKTSPLFTPSTLNKSDIISFLEYKCQQIWPPVDNGL